uniref:Uncharacterized protein n=1 Tax=Cannabis sativa TaxID=3483 RepID=A0A803NL89_CANSA
MFKNKLTSEIAKVTRIMASRPGGGNSLLKCPPKAYTMSDVIINKQGKSHRTGWTKLTWSERSNQHLA